MKRTVEEMDPDYEEISVVHTNKRHKVVAESGRHFEILECGMTSLTSFGIFLALWLFRECRIDLFQEAYGF